MNLLDRNLSCHQRAFKLNNTVRFIKKSSGQAALIVLAAAVISLVVNQFRSDSLPLIGNWSAEARFSDATGDSLVISLDTAAKLHENGGVLFIDARADGWFEVGHIKGAINLPAEEVEELFPKVMNGIALDTAIITYCDGETCNLSHDLALALMARGYSNVRVLVNGWTLWTENHLPVEQGLS